MRSICRMLSTSVRTRVAQPLDLARREADLHQLGLHLLLQLEVLGRLVPFLLQHDEHPREEPADRREARERGDLEPLEVLRGDGAGVALVLVFLDVVVGVLERVELLVEIHQAVDQVVDLELVLLDPVGELEDLRDRHRAGRDRHDHVLQAFLDPLGDLDLAFARQELDRAHFAHVHADRVGRAAELGVERRDRGLGGLLDILGRRGGRGVRHQQRFGVRGLVVDLDPHVADHADDALDLLGIEDVVGQVVVDLGERQEAALLAEHDQGLQAPLARLDVGRRQHARRDLRMPAVPALLVCCVLRALAGDLGGDLARRSACDREPARVRPLRPRLSRS